MRITTIALLALAGCAIAGAVSGAERGRAASDGVYTDAQADRGATRYAQNCARCHGADLLGTYDIPSLRGTLIARWSTVPVGDLYAYISHAMPMQAPGALSPAINADILAFILKSNGYKAGATELTPEATAMKAIRLDASNDAPAQAGAQGRAEGVSASSRTR